MEGEDSGNEEDQSEVREKEVDIELEAGYPSLKICLSSKTKLDQIEVIISSFIDSLDKCSKKIKKIASEERPASPAPKPLVEKRKEPKAEIDEKEDPLKKVSLRLEMDYEKLNKEQLFGTKEGRVQIFKPKFSPKDALLVITFIYEIGLGNTSIPYEELKETFRNSNIKSKSPLYLIIFNAAKSGYIDKQRYDTQKEITLSPKGEARVKKIIESALS